MRGGKNRTRQSRVFGTVILTKEVLVPFIQSKARSSIKAPSSL